MLYDDRPKVSPGVKFGDAELIGVPRIVIVGRGAADGEVELWDRRTGEREVPVAELLAALRASRRPLPRNGSFGGCWASTPTNTAVSWMLWTAPAQARVASGAFDMSRRSRIDPGLMRAPLRSSELTDLDIARSRMRAPADVAHPFHGVHVVGAALEGVRERAEVFAALFREGDAFSHVTAAALLGAPLPPAARPTAPRHLNRNG